jgi:hypothetical protein
MPVCFPISARSSSMLGASWKAGWCCPHSTCSTPSHRRYLLLRYCSLALALYFNLLFHKLLFILIPTNCTKALGFVMRITYSEIYSIRCQVPLQRQLALTRRGAG